MEKESGLITDLSEFAPRFQSEREELQWAAGKPSRNEVASLLAAQRVSIAAATNAELDKMSKLMQQVFYLVNSHGLQLETLIRVIDQAVGSDTEALAGKSFREVLDKEIVKTNNQRNFLSSLVRSTEPKTAKQIIQELRDWNAQEDILKIDGRLANLTDLVISELENFTPEEVTSINEEFGISISLELFGSIGETDGSNKVEEMPPTTLDQDQAATNKIDP